SRPLPAGAFSLASYQRLNDITDVIAARSILVPDRWNCIEIYYSRTTGGNLTQLASLSGLTNARDVNFHFVVYNGRGGNEGQIQSTERWLQQFSCIPGGSWYGTGSTIRICIVGDGKKIMPTDCQLKRTAALIEELSRKFNIAPKNIRYPSNWQL
ncbi:MAG: N-acetylmuramoyl-L-alanine amidase, partial [Sedimentisphaerales bacterium]|nr:N-acetylmuramoyl-L-alanine amidase [Sedimentisphaerales bacterium]